MKTNLLLFSTLLFGSVTCFAQEKTMNFNVESGTKFQFKPHEFSNVG